MLAPLLASTQRRQKKQTSPGIPNFQSVDRHLSVVAVQHLGNTPPF
jgi:hypothetical protein